MSTCFGHILPVAPGFYKGTQKRPAFHPLFSDSETLRGLYAVCEFICWYSLLGKHALYQPLKFAPKANTIKPEPDKLPGVT
jgi:hypothetical protein